MAAIKTGHRYKWNYTHRTIQFVNNLGYPISCLADVVLYNLVCTGEGSHLIAALGFNFLSVSRSSGCFFLVLSFPNLAVDHPTCL